ncbi:rab-GTPase-TBC domain protein (macronuclear) [Tetrahymena thermophila SB210]|uniref:Rab-GTPase-TBC domain protein n=1 Tax=Tetrahymena thermophila (strain SB210) TaxID=312017 RepID=Q22RX7_TETTS|nr:rab-GTPase-TBC domain protein [Tetrahymena thermophila SB210]EAR87995.3 rab-GTPase-TBC domain protein [Tetrahymena thermophila SB210]|eukprot:XP_001008240.3 rab-GTPase-TBC domain protein [Tetrahymena thermophila SB210]
MFSISWILTWFAHSFTDLNKIQRIFDFLLCSQPQTISYLSAALILITKEQLQEGLNECEGGFEQGVIFQFYQNDNLNQLEIDFGKWFQKCKYLEKTYKFDKLLLQFELPKDSNLYEHQFNQLLTYRKDLNRRGLTKLFYFVKRKLTIKNTPLIVASGLFTYYAVHNKNSLPKLLQFIKDRVVTKNIFTVQNVASVAVTSILAFYTIKNLLFKLF